MATDLGVNDVLAVRLEFRSIGNVAYNQLHYRVKTVTVNATSLPAAIRIPIAPFMTVAGPGIFGLMSGPWSAAAASNVEFTSVTIQSVYPSPRSRPFTHSPPLATPGAIVEDPLPLQDAPTLLKRTLYGERWGLGRLFFVGTPESDASTGYIDADQKTRLNTFGERLASTMVFNDDTYTTALEPVLVGKDDVGVQRVTKIVSVELSDDVLKTQRRRRPGKGI